MSLAETAARAAEEIRAAVAGIDPAALQALIEALAGAGRIVCYGVGREGLMMRALAMRLYHMGLEAHVVGDMSCPPVGPGDLLVVSAGPGGFSTVDGLIGVARGAGARIACVTARPDGSAPQAADLVLHIPAQTMADDQGAAATSVLPMGSLFEGAQYLAFELLILALRDHLAVSAEAMRARHTNLE
jgi:6-phospho-3-hexuloisomerase